MAAINDGGPAFPTDDYYDEKRIGQAGGLTLRDYFAAAALTGYLANSQYQPEDGIVQTAARDAYAHADAMLAERKKK